MTESTYQCPNKGCNSEFKSKKSYDRHVSMSKTCGLNRTPVTCLLCGNQYNEPQSLTRHEKKCAKMASVELLAKCKAIVSELVSNHNAEISKLTAKNKNLREKLKSIKNSPAPSVSYVKSPTIIIYDNSITYKVNGKIMKPSYQVQEKLGAIPDGAPPFVDGTIDQRIEEGLYDYITSLQGVDGIVKFVTGIVKIEINADGKKVKSLSYACTDKDRLSFHWLEALKTWNRDSEAQYLNVVFDKLKPLFTEYEKLTASRGEDCENACERDNDSSILYERSELLHRANPTLNYKSSIDSAFGMSLDEMNKLINSKSESKMYRGLEVKDSRKNLSLEITDKIKSLQHQTVGIKYECADERRRSLVKSVAKELTRHVGL